MFFKIQFEYILKFTQRLPLEWKNPFGYVIAIAVQFEITLIILRYIECFLTLGLAGLLLAFYTIKDIKNDLNLFNGIAKAKKSQSRSYKKLGKWIYFHINLRELSSSQFKFRITVFFQSNL